MLRYAVSLAEIKVSFAICCLLGSRGMCNMGHILVSLLKLNDVALIQCGCLICSIANGSPTIIMYHQNLTKPEFYSMCRAAFMCGREPNFELSEEEKQELRKYTWEDFLAVTRNTITSKSMTENLNISSVCTFTS